VTGDPRADRLRLIVARVARVSHDSIGVDDDLRTTHGLDSLSALRVVASVEREFGVAIPDDKLHDLPTVSAILRYLDVAR
jgi:acyl carrier protein